MSPGRTERRWSRGRDLNPRPADFSTDTMLLDSRALFLTTPYGFARYSASFVQKLFRSLWDPAGDPVITGGCFAIVCFVFCGFRMACASCYASTRLMAPAST